MGVDLTIANAEIAALSPTGAPAVFDDKVAPAPAILAVVGIAHQQDGVSSRLATPGVFIDTTLIVIKVGIDIEGDLNGAILKRLFERVDRLRDGLIA